MPKNNNKKVCIVTSSLGKGGAERCSALLSIMLSKLGYDVHIITVLPEVDYKYAGTLLNLGLVKTKKNRVWNRLKRLILFKRYLAQHNFSLIIDNRSRNKAFREYILSKFIYRAPIMYMLQNFKTSKTFTKYPWLNQYLYKNETMIAVSKAIAVKFQKKYKLSNIKTLYNCVDPLALTEQSLVNVTEVKEDYIIFYGRIDDYHKNLKLLIDAYQMSKLKQQSIKLLILGSGSDTKVIKNYVEQKQLQMDVIFKKFTSNPFPYIAKARFMVLSSRFEGFPLTILETLALNVPVVSVNCTSGPSEVIVNNHNGLLVENNNIEQLANAMYKLATDYKLYQLCKVNAKKSIEAFSVNTLSKQWETLLKDI